MKIPLSFLCLTATAFLSAVEYGGLLPLKDIAAKTDPVLGVVRPAPDGTEVVLFFDAAAPDALSCLRMIDSIRTLSLEKKRETAFLCVSRSSAQITREVLRDVPLSIAVNADRNKNAFLEFAADDILLPFAVISRGGRVQWKGSPAEIPSVLERLEKGTYSIDRQRRADHLRKELQRGIQASLPAVILRAADAILRLIPDDMIAIQAKLFVYDNTRRTGEAAAFLETLCKNAPDNLNLSVMRLDYLIRTGNRTAFQTNFEAALKRFEGSPESLFRILLFAVPNAPFAWLPLDAATAAARRTETAFRSAGGEKLGTILEIQARLAYLRTDLTNARALQREAVNLLKVKRDAENARQVLMYFDAIAHAAQEKK